MATLTGATIASTYPLLLKIKSTGIDGTMRFIQDGDGTDSAFKISTAGATVLGTLTVGVDNTGADVTFFGATTGHYLLWDESGDDLILAGTGSTLSIDSTVASTSTTTGSFHTDGGVGIALDLFVGDDLSLLSDSAVFNMGAGNDFTITHDGTTGATLAGTPISINSTGDLTLDSSTDIVLDAAGGNFEFKDAGTAQLTIDVDGTAGDIDINLMVNGDDLVFNQYDGTEVMRITDTARVGIGNDSPSYKLDVKIANGNDNTIVARFENADASDPNGIYINHSGIDLSSDDSADHSYINCADSNNTPFVVYGDGDVVNEDNSYTSDVRIKKDITDATSKLEDLLKLKVRNYKFKKSDGGDVAGKLGGKRIGFIADELEEVFPNLIVKRKTTKFGVEYDDLKSIRVSALMPILIKAVQELSASNDALKARIEVLEE
jgi:hypothetical protein